MLSIQESNRGGRLAAIVQKRHSKGPGPSQISKLVQFLLVKDQKKISIKWADILKNVIKDYKSVYSEIINRASRTLQLVFGLQLVEIDTKHHIYILVSNLLRLEGEHLKQDDSMAKLGLLTIILSLKHDVFGDIKKLVIEEFVRQKYLECKRVPHMDPPEFEFQCGAWAAKEISKMQILHFIAKIQSKDPKAWITQYNEAAAEVVASGGPVSGTSGDADGASQGAWRRNQ